MTQITGTEPVFPNNVVSALTTVLPGIDDRLAVFGRPLRGSDPNMSLGIFASLWQPEEDSFEIGHQPPREPSLHQYQIGIQSLVKDGDEQRGLIISSIVAKRIRTVLYRNTPLRVALGSLSVTDSGSVERMRRWGIRSQRYISNDIEGKFVFVSTLDLWIETEMS